MATDKYQGLLYGVMGEREEPAHAPRDIDDHAKLDTDPYDPRAGGWNLWDGFRDVEHGAQRYEGDPSAWWVGVPVASTTAPLSHYIEERGDFGADHCVDNAREVWEKFRAHCLREANYDPGEGELLMVRDGY